MSGRSGLSGRQPTFTAETVPMLRALKAEGHTWVEIAAHLGVCVMTLRRAVRGRGRFYSRLPK